MFTTVNPNSTRQLKAVKLAGFEINKAETKNKYPAVRMKKNDTEFIAVAAKNFEGDITLETYVFEGANAEGEPRLYLTNNAGGLTIGDAL